MFRRLKLYSCRVTNITRNKYGNLKRSTSVRYDYSKKKEKGIYKRLENKYEYYD